MVLEHLVVEDGEVEGEAKLDGVASGQIDLVGILVRLLGLGLHVLEDSVLGVLGNVAVVVADHLDEEGLGLVAAVWHRNHFVVDHRNDLFAVLLKLLFNGLLVDEKCLIELLVLGVLLNGGDCAASSAFAADKVFESHGKKVSLIGVDITMSLLKDILEEINHILEALSLLSDTGKENLLFDLVIIGHSCSLKKFEI